MSKHDWWLRTREANVFHTWLLQPTANNSFSFSSHWRWRPTCFICWWRWRGRGRKGREDEKEEERPRRGMRSFGDFLSGVRSRLNSQGDREPVEAEDEDKDSNSPVSWPTAHSSVVIRIKIKRAIGMPWQCSILFGNWFCCDFVLEIIVRPKIPYALGQRPILSEPRSSW